MIPGLEHVGHQRCVRVEVDPIDRRVRSEPGSLDHDEVEPLGERLLNRPRRPPAHDAAVNEDEPLHLTILRQVTK